MTTPGRISSDPRREERVETRAVRGDLEAWAELYTRHYPMIYRQIFLLCREHPLSEELAQETFVEAIANRRRYDPERPFGAWAAGIALNVVRNFWRKRRNGNVALRCYEHQRGGVSISDDHLDQVSRDRVRKLMLLLEELPPLWREAFIIRELRGLSPGEAADYLNISRANVAVRVNRARRRLREDFVARGWKESGLRDAAEVLEEGYPDADDGCVETS